MPLFKVSLPKSAMSTTVTSKGQVTIPKHVRELRGIGPGSKVAFERAPDGRIVLVKSGKKVRAGLPSCAAAPARA